MMPARLAHQENDSENRVNIDKNRNISFTNKSQMKRRSISERRHFRDKSSSTSSDQINSNHSFNDTKEPVVLHGTASSVDSGAGAEDDESGSHTASDEINANDKQRLHLVRQTSDFGSDHQISSSSSLRRKTSGKRSKSQGGGGRLSRHLTTTSDSAVSASVLSTSGLSTPTESRIFSSPNLSDHSKTSFSPKHSSKSSSNYPPLTRALRKKQERLKRELDLNETRYQIERQRFMAETYRSHRIGSFRRKDSSKGSNAGGSNHRVLQKSHSVDSGGTAESPYASSKKIEGRKVKKEYRSKSVGRDENEKEAEDAQRRSNSPMNKNENNVNRDISSAEYNVANSSQTSIYTTASSTSKNNSNNGDEAPSAKTVQTEKEMDNDSKNVNNDNDNNDNNNNKYYSDKKQKRKSRKDRLSSTSRRRRHDSQENPKDEAGKVSSTTDDNKMSTDSDDVFENMARKLQGTTTEVSNEDFDKRMNLAVDSILRDGMPDIPSTEQITETGLLDWRAVFRVEMMRLRREVNEFRVYCHNQVLAQASSAGRTASQRSSEQAAAVQEKAAPEEDPKPPPLVADQLKHLQDNMKLFQKKQQLLDLETELLAQEERLAEKQNHLEEYEKEILEVESMLNHRQAICDRRQKTLLNLDEELQTLRTELEETREQMHVDGSIPESNSERARKNWDMLKRNLMDEHKLLETTVQKYRSELASATSTIAGKDILISRLQSVSMQHEEEISARDRRIRQLESKLSIALSETKSLLDQIPSASQQNLNASKSALESEMGSTSQRIGMTSEASTPPVNPENTRFSSFRSTRSYYRRPSSNATSDHGDDYTRHRAGSGGGSGAGQGGGDGTGGGLMNGDASGAPRNSFRTSVSARKRNSVSDNAISRLTLSTPRTEGTSSACVVQ